MSNNGFYRLKQLNFFLVNKKERTKKHTHKSTKYCCN